MYINQVIDGLIVYFTNGINNSLIIHGKPLIIAHNESQIKKPGYAVITELISLKTCKLAMGYNINFKLPKEYKIPEHNPCDTWTKIYKDTIEIWEAHDLYGSEFLLYTFNLCGKGEKVFYDILAYHEGYFYSITYPFDRVVNMMTRGCRELYSGYFTLVNKIA